MHTDPVLRTHITEIADESVVLDPDKLDAETRANTWSLSASPHERAALTVDEVVTAFEATAAKIGRRITGLGLHSVATFYVWHDIQAGQLRCSTSSQPGHALPFRSPYAPTSSLEPIIAAFLDDPRPGTVAWDDLTPTEETSGDHNPTTLDVWVRPIGQDAPDPTHS